MNRRASDPPSNPPLLLDEALPPLAAEAPEHSSKLHEVLAELELLFPPDELELLEVSPPLVLDELVSSPSLPQPLEEAAPPMTLFSASASHSASPLLEGPLGSLVTVEVGAAEVEVAVEELAAPVARSWSAPGASRGNAQAVERRMVASKVLNCILAQEFSVPRMS